MLTALSINNVVLIDKLDLEFKSGLSVLTGETGAGKSHPARFSRIGLGEPGGSVNDTAGG